MLYTLPDYYKEFQCIADQCEDTCCAGWQIVIDSKSLAKYKRLCRRFFRLFYSVNWFRGTFFQDRQKRCAFLNEKNLCDLYIHEGEKSLCKTCRQYPRHMEEFEGVREITLSLSCPEVARILMERKTSVTFISYERDGEEEFEDFDPFLFSILEDARGKMLSILQNRELPIKNRTLLILAMAHDMQLRIKKQEMFDCLQVIEKYQREKALAYIEIFLNKEDIKESKKKFSKEMFEKLYELEVLREEWLLLLQETEVLLYGNKRKTYEEIQKEFAEWKKENPDMDIHLEQLLVYFLFIYFPGAVYDGEVYAKAQMAVYCVWMIHEILVARWLKNEQALELDEIIDLVYRFSREVEHSDKNLKQVEVWMEKVNWLE